MQGRETLIRTINSSDTVFLQDASRRMSAVATDELQEHTLKATAQ